MRLVICAVVAICLSMSVCRGDEPLGSPSPPPIPAFSGQELPVPPQQGKPWTVPTTKLPNELLTTTAFLFEHGCADPRGCEYREITVATGGVWGGDRGAFLTKTHGWVLPGEGKERFAIGWNGLVYPVIDVGAVATLADDLPQNGNDYGLRTSVPESWALDVKSVRLLRACLLLRLGERELAEKCWDTIKGIKDRQADEDPFQVIANEWLWAAFDRAVCAHMRGDHRLSLLTAETVDLYRDDYEMEAQRRGVPRQPDRDRPEAKVFEFLSPLETLVTDQHRRVHAVPVKRVLESPPDTYADQSTRVTALIRDLELVAARQDGQPGGVSLSESPIVKALLAEGSAAVEPLIECYETDERLTRSVSFHRDFFTHRNLIPVHDAAFVALGAILETRTFREGIATSDERLTEKEFRTRVAAKIRKLWASTGNLSKEERWFLSLADDQANKKQWLEAAYHITTPNDVQTDGQWVSIPHRKNGVVPPMKGESLRSKSNRSVAELLAQRSDEIATSSRANENSTARNYEYEDAAKMAIFLAKWDAKVCLPTLKRRMDDCLREMQPGQMQTYAVKHLAQPLGRLMKECLKAGDSEKLTQYYQWLETTPVELLMDVHPNTEQMFAPLWLRPDLPESREHAEKLFNSPGSPWNPLHRSQSRGGGFQGEALVSSPLLSVPAFRQQVLRNLSNAENQGTLTVKENMVSIKTDTRTMGVGLASLVDPDLPEPGVKQEFRRCDFYAWRLAQLHGAPAFQLYWPMEKRDESLKHMHAFVEQWGPRYSTPVPPYAAQIHSPFQEQAFFTLPPLDHPATEEEVQQGQAIFSLGTQQPTRLADVKGFPIAAKWLKSEDAPRSHMSGELTYEQDGFVYQAEEVQENGQWKRFYGFVGRHSIVRVPAEDIEIK